MNTYWATADGSVRKSNLRDWADDAMIEDYETGKFDVMYDDVYSVGCHDVIWQEEHSPRNFGRGSGKLSDRTKLRAKLSDAA
jgi:hypothetical protein